MSNKFIGYDYKSAKVPKELELLWKDSMQNFGWEVEKSEPAIVKPVWGPLRVMAAPLALIPGTPFKKMIITHKSEAEMELVFKRDKSITGKNELDRLNVQFETIARGIESLEDSKTSGATIAAYVIGLIGTVFMGVSMFSYLAESIPLMIAMAVLGFLGWIVPYFIYCSLKSKKTQSINPQIEKQHEGIYDICKKANGIIANA